MTKNKIVWVLVVALLVGWGYQNNKNEKEDALNQAEYPEKLSSEFQIQGDKIVENFSHGMHQFYICNFSKNVEPVLRMLLDISNKSSIPPDLIPVVKDFNEAVTFLSSKESVFLGKEGVLTDEELELNADIIVFAKELNLKTAELEQGIISSTNSYFKGLGAKVKDLVEPACRLYAATHPEKSESPRPTPEATRYQAPRSFDSEMDKIGKQVSYEGICKLDDSAAKLLSDIENAQISIAFKSALLGSSKTSIYDLGYAAFSFDGTGLYTPTPDEMHWTPEIKALQSNLEKYRYSYWSSSSKRDLKFMKITASKIKELGMSGCAEVKRLKRVLAFDLLFCATLSLGLLTGCGNTIDNSSKSQEETQSVVGTNGLLISIQSDNVQAAGYDAVSMTMTVQFNNGYTYEYYGIPADLWNSFIAAQPHPWSQVGNPRLVQAGVPYKRIR